MPRFTDWMTSTGGATTAEAIAGTSTSKVMTPASDAATLPHVLAGLSATATATANRAALQSAIDAANGTRPVRIPSGIFLVDGTRTGPFDALITYMSGTKVIGDGPSSVIKVANGVTAAGDYRVFAPPSTTATDNILFAGFKIDGNGANNLVTGSAPGTTLRRAHPIFVYQGEHVTVESMTIVNNPGTNSIILGTNADSIKHGRVVGNTIINSGGAISGNHLQADYSGIWTMFREGVVAHNDLYNDAFNSNSPAVRTITGIEVQGARTAVFGNVVTNHTIGGNAVATNSSSTGCSWIGNTFEGIHGAGIFLWSFAGYSLDDLLIVDNTINGTFDYTTFRAGILDESWTTTSSPQRLTIIGNRINGNPSGTDPAHGIFLHTVNGAVITDNQITNMRGVGVNLESYASSALVIEDVVIEDNIITDCGNSASRPWGIRLISATGGRISRVTVDDNHLTQAATTGLMQGLHVAGSGIVEDVTIGGRNRIFNVADPAKYIATALTTNFRRVDLEPRVFTGVAASDPTSGIWLKSDQALHTDVAAAGFIGRVCTTQGAASSAVWATATAYTVGQWVRTSGGKVLECTTAGTSHASTEPNPSTLGEAVTDGTVTWAYRSATLAVFKTFGAVSA